MDEKINFIGDMQRVQVRPGDVFVVQTDQRLTHDMSLNLRDYVRSALGDDARVLVLTDGLKLGVAGEDFDPIEGMAAAEYREGVSPGAAARQLCRSLGAHGVAPTLKRLLEDMLSNANRASFDRSQILSDFDAAAPEAAAAARVASHERINAA